MRIPKVIENLSDCHLATELKITKIINFWERFYLSLPGRLNIAKTLLLSQISYLGCIITPAPETLKSLKKKIEKFITGGLNIAKDRVYKQLSLGGLGMIDIEDFICAQQVIWFKRANQSTRDNWRVDLKKIGNGNVLTAGKLDFSVETFPIFKYLAESYNKFLVAFNKTNDNFSKSFLLNNPSMTISRYDTRPINFNFLTSSVPLIERQAVCQLRIDQIALNGRLLSIDEITANTGLHINLLFYLRLQTAFHTSAYSRTNGDNGDGSSISLQNFLKRFRKGSKQIRCTLSGIRTAGVKVGELRNIITFENLLNTPAGDDNVRKKMLSFWGFTFVPMNIREFSFKFFNNSLGLNQRLAHFVEGRGGGCTFCSLNSANNGPVPPETFTHFFFDCMTSLSIREWFENTFIPEIPLVTRDSKIKFWFYGIIPLQGEKSNLFVFSVVQTFFYSLWRFKLLRRKPIRLSFELEFFYNLKKIVDSSRLIRENMNQVDIMLCRNWDIFQQRRG